MRAAIRTSGGISFSSVEPKAVPAAGQVLLHVMAAGINPADYKIPKIIGGKVVGLDVAGTVEACGPGVTSFAKGDEVFGFAIFGNGGIADFALADVKKITCKPKDLSWTAAGSFATTFLTGYQCLREHGRMEAGHSVLVIGASGGCGTAGVQLAKAIGASEVVAVCSQANAELVSSLGATRVVDYRDPASMEAMRTTSRFDVIYDCATGSGGGEDYSADAQAMLKPGGTVVAINGGVSAWLRLLFKCQSKSRKLMLTRQNGEELATILGLLGDSAKDAVIIDSTHEISMEGINAAFERLKSRRARGKVVFDATIGRELLKEVRVET
jgi:NADPH:quinone reductase-like Zn-dependent oxidoreductase